MTAPTSTPDSLAIGSPCPPVDVLFFVEAFKDTFLVLLEANTRGLSPIAKQFEIMRKFQEAYLAISEDESSLEAAMWRFNKFIQIYFDLGRNREQAGKYLMPSTSQGFLLIDMKAIRVAALLPFNYWSGFTWKDLLEHEGLADDTSSANVENVQPWIEISPRYVSIPFCW